MAQGDERQVGDVREEGGVVIEGLVRQSVAGQIQDEQRGQVVDHVWRENLVAPLFGHKSLFLFP